MRPSPVLRPKPEQVNRPLIHLALSHSFTDRELAHHYRRLTSLWNRCAKIVVYLDRSLDGRGEEMWNPSASKESPRSGCDGVLWNGVAGEDGPSGTSRRGDTRTTGCSSCEFLDTEGELPGLRRPDDSRTCDRRRAAW